METPTLNMNDLNRIVTPNTIRCPKCNNSWLKQIEVAQYSTFNTVVIGQTLPPLNAVVFILLECPKCGELLEPQIQISQRDSIRKLYDNLLDEMERDASGAENV
jgi:phage FluMu protein Com